MLHAGVSYKGEPALYQLLSVVDCSSTITAGREIYGQPFKFGYPSLVMLFFDLVPNPRPNNLCVVFSQV